MEGWRRGGADYVWERPGGSEWKEIDKERERENPTHDEKPAARGAHRSHIQRRMELRPPDLCLIKLSHLIRSHIYYRKQRPLVRTSQGQPALDKTPWAINDGIRQCLMGMLHMMEGDATISALFIRGLQASEDYGDDPGLLVAASSQSS